jgi:hypothetical protein
VGGNGRALPAREVVSHVDGPNVWIIEAHATGLWEKRAWNIEWFEVWRPNCNQTIKDLVVQDLRDHQGLVYAYHKFLMIAAGTRLGLWQEAEDFDATHYDCEPMYCAEAIARHYWRRGYDLVPGVSNRNTLPKDLRNPTRLTFMPA